MAKLGGEDLRMFFQQKIENGTEQQIIEFLAQNERKRSDFIVSLRLIYLLMIFQKIS